MKKYNLSKIMKRAWELVKKEDMTMSASLKKAWSEAKNPSTDITFCVIGKETFTVNTQTGIVTGKTYNSRKFLKDNFSATWDGQKWTVDVAKFSSELSSYADYYKKYIVSTESKKVVYKKLVNRNDGFYSYVEYSNGSHEYIFVG